MNMEQVARLPHAFLAEIGPITKSCTQVVMLAYFVSRAAGRSKTAPVETPDLDVEHVAEICGCTVSKVWEEMEQLSARVIPVLAYQATAPGKFRVRLFTERWRERAALIPPLVS